MTGGPEGLFDKGLDGELVQSAKDSYIAELGGLEGVFRAFREGGEESRVILGFQDSFPKAKIPLPQPIMEACTGVIYELIEEAHRSGLPYEDAAAFVAAYLITECS